LQAVVQFADILLFHQAYRAIKEVMPSLSRINSPSLDMRLLNDGLIRWPRNAAQTWEQATAIVRTHLPSRAERLDRLIAAPDFGVLAQPIR
jgi:hypothetical protein